MTIQQKPIIHGRDHLPGGPDPIPGLPSPVGDDVEDIIKALPGLDAFWKLDETSGTVAADSSGNDHDLQPGGGLGAPTWGQAAGPPGDPTAFFATGNVDGLNSNANVAMSAFTNNFTAGIWANWSSNVFNNELIGQGAGGHSSGGWTLGVYSGKLKVAVATHGIDGDNTLSTDTWYFLACVRDSGTFKGYVNGLLQADTMTTSFTGSTDTWIGNDNFSGHTTYLRDGYLSYGFIVNAALSSTELLEIYEAGFTGGTTGADKVWTTDGSGGASWEYPTIGVNY